MAKNVEIERRFLVRCAPEAVLSAAPTCMITQGYLDHRATISLITDKDGSVLSFEHDGSRASRVDVPVPVDQGQAVGAMVDPATGLLGSGSTDGKVSVRIRRVDATHVLTIKVGSGVRRSEIEFDVPPAEGQALLLMSGADAIAKRRHLLDGWEVDVFAPPFDGITVAECELEHETDPLPPLPAGFELSREVTDELSTRELLRLGPSAARSAVGRILDRPRTRTR